jgi:UDP-glucose 4-epimerase
VPDRAAFAAANIAGTQAVAAAATRAGSARFIHVSSLAAREPALSDYGWSKAGAEDVVRAAALPAAIVRPPAIYGPRDTEVFELFKMAASGLVLLPPPGRASLIHVRDLAALFLTLAMTPDFPAGAVYEVDDGTPGGFAHRTLGRAIAVAVGRPRAPCVSAPRWLMGLAARGDRLVRGTKAKLTPDRAAYMAHPDWVSDPVKSPPPALWQPRIGHEQGLAATADWYRAAGWLR